MYTLKVNKKAVVKTIENAVSVGQVAATKVASNVGVGTAAVTKVGLDPLREGTAISKNIDIDKAVKSSPHAEPQPDRIPSPDSNFIPSPLETEITSPLQDMLLYSYIVDILIIILIILFLLTIFHRYLGKSNLQIINSIIKNICLLK